MKKLSIEEKSLLLRDLSARLSYGVICNDSRHGDSRITEIDIVEETVYCHDFDEYVDVGKIKPYLRPMSSMTEEEKDEFRLDFHYYFYIGYEYSLNNKDGSYMMPMFVMRDYFDWLNAHHFDYRGLIEKGLALEALEGMYETEKQKN